MTENSDTPRCGHETTTGEDCKNPATDGEYCWIETHGNPDGENPQGAPEDNDNAVGNPGGSPPEDNTNSVTHGLFAETNHFYQEVMSDEMRELCDEIFADYLEEFEERNRPPHMGHKSRLFEISVNHIKIIYSDNWAHERPSDLDSGNPMVDRETKVKSSQHEIAEEVTYKESVVVGTQQKLRREDRAWLRDYGMLDSPEKQMADAEQDKADAWREALSGMSE